MLHDFGWQLKKCHPAAIRCCFTAIGDSTHVFKKIHICFIPRQSCMLSSHWFLKWIMAWTTMCVGVVTRSRAYIYIVLRNSRWWFLSRLATCSVSPLRVCSFVKHRWDFPREGHCCIFKWVAKGASGDSNWGHPEFVGVCDDLHQWKAQKTSIWFV